jgi:TM2 domain-containing membrane protein YozV
VLHEKRLSDAGCDFNGKEGWVDTPAGFLYSSSTFFSLHPRTMKKSIVAPLCSGLVIPGLGQILNQQIRKGVILLGSVFLLFVAGAVKLAFIINSVTRQPELSETFLGAAVGEGDLLFVAGIVAAFAILWVYSVVDAFRVALRSERSAGDKGL